MLELVGSLRFKRQDLPLLEIPEAALEHFIPAHDGWCGSGLGNEGWRRGIAREN